MPKIIHINNIEVKGNKVSKIDSNSTNIEYPSAKAVYDMISSLEPSGGGTSDNNTLIEDPVNDWDTLYTVLMEYDKVFTTGGSVTVYTEGSLWGASGFYNIKSIAKNFFYIPEKGKTGKDAKPAYFERHGHKLKKSM